MGGGDVDLEEIELAAPGVVVVAVAEAGEDHGAAQVDQFGGGAHESEDLGIAADRGDAAAGDGDGLGAGAGGIDGVEGGVVEDCVGGHGLGPGRKGVFL